VATQEGLVVFSKSGTGGDEISISAGQSYAGSDVTPLTAEQIAVIEAALEGKIYEPGTPDSSSGGTGPGTGPTFPDVDTSISVSVN
jgi:hypothetical protein